MVGKVVEYPFDTVKVRLQIQPTHQPHYTGALDCITRTLRHEGVKGLFKVGRTNPSHFLQVLNTFFLYSWLL